MYRMGYPGLEQHRRLYRELIDKLSNKECCFLIQQSSQNVEAVIDFLLDWFFHHTLNINNLFSNYLKNKNAD